MNDDLDQLLTSLKMRRIREVLPRALERAGFNLVFIGNAGVGKTGLATGILYKALVNGHRGRFIRAQDLFDEINASLLERSSRRVLNELCGYTLSSAARGAPAQQEASMLRSNAMPRWICSDRQKWLSSGRP